MFPFTVERRANWSNRDYRDYCDYRIRLKRRLRLRFSIVLALLGCLFLTLGLSTFSTQVKAQSEQLIESIKTTVVLSAPGGLQGSNNLAGGQGDATRSQVELTSSRP